MNNKGPSHALKSCTFFFINFAKKSIIQITRNAILYHWHLSPATNYGKLLILFFFKHFPNPRPFPFSFDLLLMITTRQQDSNSTSSSGESILRMFYNFSSCTFYTVEMLILLMATWGIIKEQMFPKKLFLLNNFLISRRVT